MTIEIIGRTSSTVRVLYNDGKMLLDIEVPISELKGPVPKLGKFAQADVDWGYRTPPAPKPFDQLTFQEIQAAVLDYVQKTLKKSP